MEIMEKKKKNKGGRPKNPDGPPKKTCQSRCSPKCIVTMFKKLKEDEKHKKKLKEIKIMGFECLQFLPDWSLKQDFMPYLAKNFNSENNSFEADIGEIKINGDLIEKALGLPSRGDKFPSFNGRNDKHLEVKDRWNGKLLRKVKEFVLECKMETKPQRMRFREAFLLVVLKTFLLPTSSNRITAPYLPPILDVEDPKRFNWSLRIYEWLSKEIKKHKRKKTQFVGGCTLVLVILYMHGVLYGSEDKSHNNIPWAQYFTAKDLDDHIAEKAKELRLNKGKEKAKGKSKENVNDEHDDEPKNDVLKFSPSSSKVMNNDSYGPDDSDGEYDDDGDDNYNALVDFKGLCKVDKEFVQLLEEVCSMHPNLVERHRKRKMSQEFNEWSFTILGKVLHFLKTKKVKDMMNDDACKELQHLWEELEIVKFDDLSWLKKHVDSALGVKKHMEKEMKVKRLKGNVNALEREVKSLKDQMIVAEINLERARRELGKEEEGFVVRDLNDELVYM